VRIEAIKALSTRGSQADIRSLATALTDSWEVREALVNVLPGFLERPELKYSSAQRAAVEQVLAEKAQKDRSTRVRAASMRALAKIKSEQAPKILAAALKVDSQSDEIRQAAIEAMADLDTPKTLQSVMIYALPGHDTRTRPVAVAAMAKLGHQDQAATLKALVGYLSDRELRTQRAAGQAMVDLKDEKAMAEFDKAEAHAQSDELRQQIADWKKALKEKLEEPKK
jgi:HEAT repeat protein